MKDNISSTAKAALQEGKSTKEVIEAVLARFPYSKICPSAISQYRRQLGLAKTRTPKAVAEKEAMVADVHPEAGEEF